MKKKNPFKMKNFFKARFAPVIGIIALVAVIGFSMFGCKTDDGGDDGGLPAPTGLTATVSSTTLQVTWNAVTGATGYNFYASTDSSFPPSLRSMEKVGVPTYTEYDIPPGTYYIKVAAYNANGEGAMSNVVSVTITTQGGSNNNGKKYRVEVYNTDSATNAYISNTYGGKTIADLVRAAVISRGFTAANTYTNQTFEQAKDKLIGSMNAVNMPSSYITEATNAITETLQTNNQKGCYFSFTPNTSGSIHRVVYIKQE